jgi:mannose-6-phosphate isomerase-like protein (cupin superfamily)
MTAIVTWRFTKEVSFSSSRHSSENHYFIVYGYGIIMNDLTVRHRIYERRCNLLYTIWAAL